MQALLRKIEAEVHRYMPDYIVRASLIRGFNGEKSRVKLNLPPRGITIASNATYDMLIEIGLQYLEEAPYEDVMDTVKHEIAHSFSDSGEEDSHGKDWKNIARVMGAIPSEYSAFKPHLRQPRYTFRSQDGDVYQSYKPMEIAPGEPHLPGRYYVKDVITGQKWVTNLP